MAISAEGGKSARIVNCVLALKSYYEWKQAGGSGSWKYGGNVKPLSTGKPFVLKNSEPFMNSISRTSSASEKSLEPLAAEGDLSIDDCMVYAEKSNPIIFLKACEFLGMKPDDAVGICREVKPDNFSQGM
ncbi:hypothetical protein Drorol1_Dr00013550 [Drosera rotundifolia]